MPSPLIVSASRAIPLGLDETFQRTLTAPLSQLFSRRYGVLPVIRSTTGFIEPWGSAVGQSRTIRTADGGSMLETLLQVDAPRSFAYQLGSITGPMVVLAASVEGTWSFEPVGTGTRVTWSWTVRAANGVGALALPAFGRMWRGYARQALEELERALLA
ncbi:SRPBCC family protein [Dermatophilaceae bacterium Sec6.4]